VLASRTGPDLFQSEGFTMKRRVPLVVLVFVAAVVAVYALRVYREVSEADLYGPRTVAKWSHPRKAVP